MLFDFSHFDFYDHNLNKIITNTEVKNRPYYLDALK